MPACLAEWVLWSPTEERVLLVTAGDPLVFRRRRREWWWGHFYRPEVWAAIVFGSLWLWSVGKHLRSRLRERRAG